MKFLLDILKAFSEAVYPTTDKLYAETQELVEASAKQQDAVVEAAPVVDEAPKPKKPRVVKPKAEATEPTEKKPVAKKAKKPNLKLEK